MTQDEWKGKVPREITLDPLWRVEAYRLGLFLADLSWPDCAKLLKERRTVENALRCTASGSRRVSQS